MTYQGVYINLASSTARRESLERHLASVGALVQYERFEAVDYRNLSDPNGGSVGLRRTHERIAERFGGSRRHLHVIEDDILMANGAVPLFESMLANADAAVPGWDLILTDIYFPPVSDVFRIFFTKMLAYERDGTRCLLPLAGLDFASAASVFINRASIPKWHKLLTERPASVPIDLLIRQLVRQKLLSAYVTVPFLTTLGPANNDSTIRGKRTISQRVCELLRRGFFIEADHEALAAEMHGLVGDVEVHPLAALFSQAELFTLSDGWEKF